MKLGIFTDSHLGCRGGSNTFREYFKWYFENIMFPTFKKQGIDTILMGGDFFDNRNHLSLRDIDFVEHFFLPLLDEYQMKMIVIAGNHDVAFKNTNEITSLSILEKSSYVEVVKDSVRVLEFGDTKIAMTPWINPSNHDDIVDDLENVKDKDNTIVYGHFEISGFPMYKNSATCEHGLSQSFFKGFKAVWSGHFHHASKIGNIRYLGALFHMNWQDYNDARGFYVYDVDADDLQFHENEYCLFNEIQYTDDIEITEDELDTECHQRFVKIIIDCEYDKVRFMDFFSKVTHAKPLDVQIVNNYAITHSHEKHGSTHTSDSDDGSVDDHSISDYIHNYVESVVTDETGKTQIKQKFDDVYKKAHDEMVAGE